MSDDGSLSLKEAAREVGVKPDTLRRWAAEGRTLHAIYDDAGRPAQALGAGVPVATLSTFTAGLAVRGITTA